MDMRSVVHKFREKRVCVLNSNPDPSAWLALRALTQHDRLSIA
jgi:hypothetical protein